MTLVLNNAISKEAREDILDLQKKIDLFKGGKSDEERFKSFRLTRGVYGQRQLGVQMLRIKIPYGRLTGQQLVRIADVSEEYTNGNLHTTTRQNIQLHYVKLEDSPQIWAKLEEVGVTTKEACGNTVRGITGSAFAGIDPEEPFDVSPYAHEAFLHFLRNPICQEMGRKIKVAFSSSEKDSAYTYFHDFGFIPAIKKGADGEEIRGFKTLVGGGLGAQAIIAQTVYDFLPEDQVIPFMEASIRVFDRYGEREKRHKARLKFLIEGKRGLGIEKFLKLVEEERKSLPSKTYPINRDIVPASVIPAAKEIPATELEDTDKYERWLKTNVFEQKQKGYYGVNVKLLLGDIDAEKTRKFVNAIDGYVADDIRVTVNQGFALRYARKEALPYLFKVLDDLGLAEPGFGSIADITACPGTDTCNLGVTNSTAISIELERLINEEFPHLVGESDIQIKISGCMNSCGQHMAANIGFHGSSIKHGTKVIPALQVVLGGGISPDGKGFIADKVIKLPSKKIPAGVRTLLTDYENNSKDGEYYNDYYQRLGKMYFYNLLKPFADVTKLIDSDYIDWGHNEAFIPEIGVGECAGVSYDVVGTIIGDAEEKVAFAEKALSLGRYSDAIYHCYSSFVTGAKALLLSIDAHCNTHKGIIEDFNTKFYATGEVTLEGVKGEFENIVLEINKNEPSQPFAEEYLKQAKQFFNKVIETRGKQILSDGSQEEKLVVQNFYKA